MDTTLTHYGVLGMKWGKRKAKVYSTDHTTARGIQKKKLSEMSNDELKKLTTRLQLEKQYRDLDTGALNTGEKMVKNILKNVTQQTIQNYISKTISSGLSSLDKSVKGN